LPSALGGSYLPSSQPDRRAAAHVAARARASANIALVLIGTTRRKVAPRYEGVAVIPFEGFAEAPRLVAGIPASTGPDDIVLPTSVQSPRSGSTEAGGSARSGGSPASRIAADGAGYEVRSKTDTLLDLLDLRRPSRPEGRERSAMLSPGERRLILDLEEIYRRAAGIRRTAQDARRQSRKLRLIAGGPDAAQAYESRPPPARP
jgi:hypothetical protein